MEQQQQQQQEEQQQQKKEISAKNAPFFKFKDDYDSESEKKSMQVEIKPQPQEEKHEHDKKAVNVKSGVIDDDDDQVKGDKKSQQQEKEEQEEQPEIQQEPQKKKKKSQIIILQTIVNVSLFYPFLIIIGILSILVALCKLCCLQFEGFKVLLQSIVFLVIPSSIVMVIIQAIICIFKEQNTYSLWYFDSFLLFLSHIMIYTLVSMTKRDNYDLDLNNVCVCNGQNNIEALVYVPTNEYKNDCNAIMDIPLTETEWEKEYLRILGHVFEVDIKSQRFNSFFNDLEHNNYQQYIGFQLIRGQQQFFRPHKGQFIALMAISALKIYFCILYLIFNETFGWDDVFTVFVIIIFTINEVQCITIMLSNYDLRRKTMMNQMINNAILYSGDEIDYKKVVDVTNNISIETWDNSRRSVYLFFSEMQTKLERSYICLLLYYIFIACIILAAYGEIYLVIPKESILLEPLMVISSIFTFIFLNALIFFRLYFGSKYNETFEDAEDKVDLLIGIYQDLIQMYDYNFTQKGVTKQLYFYLMEQVCPSELGEESQIQEVVQEPNQNQFENNQEIKSRAEDQKLYASQLKIDGGYAYTCYDLLVSKFMYISDYHIVHGIEFQGKIYKKDSKKELEQKMMKNCLKSLKRIKDQIIVDNKQQCYKAFNIIKLDFQDTLVTISLGLLTLLPQIITKFIEQFQAVQGQSK